MPAPSLYLVTESFMRFYTVPTVPQTLSVLVRQ